MDKIHLIDHDGCDFADPGNLADRVDEITLRRTLIEYRALDGSPHVTPEDVERAAAELSLMRLRGEP